MDVSIDQRSLAPGIYYGQVRIDSADAPNTPQAVTVFARVLDPDAKPAAIIQPSEVTVTAAQGESPSSQDVLIYNLARSALRYSTSRIGSEFQGVLPFPDGGVSLPDQPARLRIKISTTGLGPGIYTYPLTLQFSDGTVAVINVKALVRGSTPISPLSKIHSAEGCSPSRLLPAVVSLGSAGVAAGWPAGLVVDISDDCGSAISAGRLVATFSNGDPAVEMRSLGSGRWHGTWQAGAANAPVTVKFAAAIPEQNLSGTSEVVTGLVERQDPPVTPLEGIVSVADPKPFAPLAPGASIAINGSGLSTVSTAAPGGAALPFVLGDVEALIGARNMPLYSVSDKLVKAIVPYDLPPDAPHQIWLRRGKTYSTPVLVNVAQAQPAVFVKEGTRAALLLNNGPVSPGDTITVLCTGLGAVRPSIQAGAVASSTEEATVQPVRVRFGAVSADALFSGLLPAMVGVYQVRVRVPDTIAPGSGVPLTIETAGQASPEVTISITPRR